MPFTASYTTSYHSQASTGDWSPSQGFRTDSGTMDPAFWIDISDGNYHNYNANGHIDSITDKSGNSTLSINDPTSLWRGSIGGKYVMMFQGNTSVSTTSTIVQSSNGNHWAIGLMKYQNINTVDDAFWHMESKDGTNGDYAVESRSSYGGWTGETRMGWLGNADDNSSVIYWSSGTTQTIGQNTWALIAVYFNRTGNQIGARVDGVDIHTPVGYDANNVGGQGLSTNLEVHLFKSRTGSQGTFFGGTLVEFLTFADIPGTGGTDVSYIEIVEGYIAHKWNIPGGNNAGHDFVNRNLPNNHPFKNSAP